MKGLIGRKIGMTSVFAEDGTNVSCTLIEAGPCYVTALKTNEKDGYSSVQVGFKEMKKKKVSKLWKIKFKKLKVPPLKYLKEIRDFDQSNGLKIGDTLGADMFQSGDLVKVAGTSKGKGFQGVVRRHGFGGGFKTHGQSDRLRAPGSIGASSYPSRVYKGQRMAGRMGGERKSVRNLLVVKVIPESNLILVKGAVPGANSGILEIYKVK